MKITAFIVGGLVLVFLFCQKGDEERPKSVEKALKEITQEDLSPRFQDLFAEQFYPDTTASRITVGPLAFKLEKVDPEDKEVKALVNLVGVIMLTDFAFTKGNKAVAFLNMVTIHQNLCGWFPKVKNEELLPLFWRAFGYYCYWYLENNGETIYVPPEHRDDIRKVYEYLNPPMPPDELKKILGENH